MTQRVTHKHAFASRPQALTETNTWPSALSLPNISLSLTSARSSDKSKRQQLEKAVSLLAVTLKGILELFFGSGCQFFNVEWEEEE